MHILLVCVYPPRIAKGRREVTQTMQFILDGLTTFDIRVPYRDLSPILEKDQFHPILLINERGLLKTELLRCTCINVTRGFYLDIVVVCSGWRWIRSGLSPR